MSNKQDVVSGLVLVALGLGLTSVATHHWSTRGKDGIKGNMGLWKLCLDVKGGANTSSVEGCVDLPLEGVKKFPKNSLHAVRAFSIMGVVLLFLSLLCTMYMKSHKRYAMMLLLGGALSLVISAVVWGLEFREVWFDNNKTEFNLSWSWGLNLASGLVALFAVGVLYYGKHLNL